MSTSELLQKADIQHIADEGMKIYGEVKSQFEPRENGKYLAIDVTTKKVYFADSSKGALDLAAQNHPNVVFYLAKIGYEAVETITKSSLSKQ